MGTRRFPRVPVFRRALVDGLVHSEGLVAAATVMQLGPMGCGLRTMELLLTGTPVRVTFYDDNEDSPLSLLGRVVYRMDEGNSGYARYGIAFEKIEEGRGNLTHALLNMALRATGYPLLPGPA